MLIAAIGIQETGFIDKNASGANDLTTAADWAAKTLVANEKYIDTNIDTTASMAFWMLASSWNTGAYGQFKRWNNGESPDWQTSPNGKGGYGNHYGQNVLNLLEGFN